MNGRFETERKVAAASTQVLCQGFPDSAFGMVYRPGSTSWLKDVNSDVNSDVSPGF